MDMFTKVVHVRVSESLHKKVAKRAKKLGMSTSTLCRFMLEAAIKSPFLMDVLVPGSIQEVLQK